MPSPIADKQTSPRRRDWPFATLLLVPFLVLVALPAALLGWFAVRSVEDARKLLASGADKVAVNTAAIKRPALILSKPAGRALWYNTPAH